MNRKTYSPYRVQDLRVNRFRGVANAYNQLTIDKPFVSRMDGLQSFRIGELEPCDNPEKSMSFFGDIDAGKYVIGMGSVYCCGENLWLDDAEMSREHSFVSEPPAARNQTVSVVSGRFNQKTYMRRVFGGKDNIFIGIDNGKSQLYNRTQVGRSDGLKYDENSIQPSGIQSHNSFFYGDIDFAIRLSGQIVICSDGGIWMEEQ
jgi:hypothetical protein